MSQASWVKSLSVEEVCSWLGSLGISEETVELFHENQVRGEDFLELTKEDLKNEICIKKIAERKRIYLEIQNILYPPSSEDEDEEEEIAEIEKNGKNDSRSNSPDKVVETPELTSEIKSPTNGGTDNEVEQSPKNSPKENEKKIDEEKKKRSQKSLDIEIKNSPRVGVTPRKPIVMSAKSLKDIPKKPKKEKFQKPYVKPLILPGTQEANNEASLSKNLAPPVIADVNDEHVEEEAVKESPDPAKQEIKSPAKKVPLKKTRIKLPDSVNQDFEKLSPRSFTLSPKYMSQSTTHFQSPRSPRIRHDHVYVSLKEIDGRIKVSIVGGRKNPSLTPGHMPPLPSSKAPELSSTSLTDSMDLGTTSILTKSISDFFQTDRRKTVVEEYEMSLKEHKLMESKSFFDVIASPRERTTSVERISEQTSPKKIPSFVKVEKDVFSTMVSNKGDSVAQFMRRGYRVLLFFLPHLGGNLCTHTFEDISKAHKALLLCNTIPMVVHLDFKDKEFEYFESGAGKKFNKIASISDYGMDLHRTFKVDISVAQSVMGLFKGNKNKKESQSAAFLLEDFEVISQQYLKKPTSGSEKFDFLKFAMIPSEDCKKPNKPLYNLSSGFKTTMIDLTISETNDQPQQLTRKFTIFKAIQSDNSEDIQMYLKDVLSHSSRINYLRLFIAKEGTLPLFFFHEFIQNVFSKEENETQIQEYAELMSNTFFNNFSIYYLGESTEAYFEGKLQKGKIDMDVFYAFVEHYMYNNLKTSYANFMKHPLFREMATLYPNSAKFEDFKKLKSLRHFGDGHK